LLADPSAGDAGSRMGSRAPECIPAWAIARGRRGLSRAARDPLPECTVRRPVMKICIFGKYPPIQGGVSMRTYWVAHGLARLGHTVHVVTNANEVTAPYRMYMREEDWARCDGKYDGGSVKVHWTESYGKREWHIPGGVPYVTKLASLGLELAQSERF